MARRPRSINYANLDVFEAVKRAFIRRGFVRKNRPVPITHDSTLQPQIQEVPGAPKPKTPKKGQAPATKVETPNPVDTDPDEQAENSEQLVELTTNAHEILLEASTVFPFTLFPSTVTIDREKLTIANRAFFKVATINSIPITDVQSVEINIGPFFGSVSIQRAMSMSPTTPFHVKFLWRDDALKIQRILQGYIIAHQKKIDCSVIEKEQLIVLLNDLGQGVPD